MPEKVAYRSDQFPGSGPQKEDLTMARKKHTAEEIVAKLQQVELLVSQGKSAADAVRVG